jgi:hypothetical protein
MVKDSAGLMRRSRLLPIGGGSDASEVIRQRVREGLLSGALPPVDGSRSWAGRGTGRTCRICIEPIGPEQIEHEVEVPDSVLVHQACLIIWRDESGRAAR